MKNHEGNGKMNKWNKIENGTQTKENMKDTCRNMNGTQAGHQRGNGTQEQQQEQQEQQKQEQQDTNPKHTLHQRHISRAQLRAHDTLSSMFCVPHRVRIRLPLL